MARVTLEPYFLHAEQAQGILGLARSTAALARANSRSIRSENPVPYALAAAMAETLPHLGIPELQRAVHEHTLRVGDLVGVEQVFQFRRESSADAPGYKPVAFSAALSTQPGLTISGVFNAMRLASNSAAGSLSGDLPAYVVGTVVEYDATHIAVRPAFIGVRTYIDDEELAAYGLASTRRVHPADVDQFAPVDFLSPISPAEVAQVLRVAEEIVKTTIARLLDEHYVHKDWGGERSDLYTSRMHITGRPVSSAWMFKGKSFPRPMTVRALGKPGDQIDRLFSQPAEVLVLQHCHEITPPVVNMMETYANDLRNPRRYMIIDGADTARILKSQGLLTAS
jgi:hypothetical protein